MPYQAQVSCDPRAKPGVTAFAALMRAHYMTGATGTFRPCQADTSEHYDGRAVDWMNSVNDPRQKAVADSVTAWLSADSGVMARRFGISYIIWNHRMWREYAPERGWVLYTGAVPHTDHIHFSFSWDGAMQRTSWWTGRATTVVDQGPCRVFAGQYAPLYQAFRTAVCPTNLPAAPASPYPVCVIGQKNAQIVVAQRVLGVTADGDFGMGTFNTLVSWQTRAAVPVTGVLDKATWAKLVPTPPAPAPPPVAKPPVAPAATTPYTAYKRVVLRQGSRGSAVVFLQRALKVTPDGAFGPRTRSSLVTFQAQHRMSPNGVADRLVWDRLEKRDYPLLAYRGLTLRQGSRGLAVAAVQRALRVTANGVFGSVTGASVKAVQSRARLAPTGVVSGWTWVAIERQIAR
jgi:peptidoglycan hydrolase-like protein with peptidoglycan-binding domain